MEKPICYLDVDGVLYYYPKVGSEDFVTEGTYVGIRPYIMGLLQTIHNCGYELRMLTCNADGGHLLLESCLASGFLPLKWLKHPSAEGESSAIEFPYPKKIPSCYFNKDYLNDLNPEIYSKAAYVDFSRDFIWIEDGIVDTETELLKDKGILDCYLYVDPHNCNELLKVKEWIKNHRITKKHFDSMIITPEEKEGV